MYFMVDQSGTILSVNPFGAEQLGYRVEELLGTPVLDVFHEADREAVQRHVSTCLSHLGQTMMWEFRKVRKDGRIIWVRETAKAVRFATSEHVVLVACEDITERKRAEEAARAAKARFEGILEIAQDAIISVDSNQQIILFNQGAEKVFGYTQAEIIGRPLDLLLPQRVEDVHRKHIEDFARSPDVARTMGQRREVSGRRKDGGEFPAEASISKLDLGSQLVFTVILRDITERKRTEAMLAGEKRVLEMVAKGDSLSQILDSLCRLVEERAPDILASILLVEHNLLRHGGAPSLPKAYSDAIDGVAIGPCVGSCGTAAYRGEQVIVSDIATDPLWVDYRAAALSHSLRACWSTPIFSSEGKVNATFAMYYREPRRPGPHEQEMIGQITHLAGVAIQRARAERQVVERTSELLESQERLRALATELTLTEQRERQRFATELHDHLQQLLVLCKVKLNQGKRLVESIPSGAALIEEMDETMSKALAYSRSLVAELSPPMLREYGLVASIKWLAEWMQNMNLAVTVEVQEEPITLPEAQAVLLFQSVRELLINASKYSGTGHATVRLNVIEEHLTIEVQDQGAGFDLHAATAPALSSGDLSSRFGLFSIRERMIALGGSLEMHSAVGKGTHAILRLPFVGPPPSGKTTHGERAEPVSPEFGQPPDRWS